MYSQDRLTSGFSGLLSVLLFCHLKNSQQYQIVRAKVQECKTRAEAGSSCPFLYHGSALPLIRDEKEYEHVQRAMVTAGINVTWLQLKRRHLGQFLWLNCQKPSAEFSSNGWSATSNCAYLAMDDEKGLAAGFCFRHHGVICDVKDCKHCQDMKCIRVGSRCFHKTCTKFSWEAARVYCRSRGLDMAIIQSSETERQLRTALATDSTKCPYMWVGLRRQDWRNPIDDGRNTTRVYWGNGQPNLTGDCSLMVRASSGEFSWRAVACNDKFPSLCMIPAIEAAAITKQKNNTTTPVHVYTSQNALPVIKYVERDSHQGLTLALTVIFAMVALVVTVAVPLTHFLWIRVKKRSKCATSIVQSYPLISPEVDNNLPENMRPQSERGTRNDRRCTLV